MKTTNDFTTEQLELPFALLALSIHLGVEPEDIKQEGYDRYSYEGAEYLVGDDDEMNGYWEEDLDNYLEECIYPELSGNLSMYFDDEKWKRDARTDGRANSLNRYDGGEEEQEFDGTVYYIYRQN
jgi:hypothetical protein